MKKSYHTKKTSYWAKHLRKVGKRIVNKQTRREAKEYFETFEGLLKEDLIGELMQEKRIEKKL